MAQALADAAFLAARVPLVAKLPVGAVPAALADARPFVDLRVYREQSDFAHAMKAAHFLACRFPDDLPSGGPVASLSAGEISASFAVTAPPAEALDQSTPYGRTFAEIKQGRLAPYQIG